MRSWKCLLLLALLGTAIVSPACAASDDDDEYMDPGADSEERAVLIAHKSIAEDRVVQGRNVTVKITLHNVGKGTAEGVKIKDVLPAAGKFDLIEGSLEKTINSIDSGRKAEHTYVLIPRFGNKAVLVEPATITYTPSSDAKATTLLSSSPNTFVLTSSQNLEVYLVKLGKYLSMGMLKSSSDWISSGLVIGTVMVTLGGYAAWTSLSQTRAESRRQAAAKALGLSD